MKGVEGSVDSEEIIETAIQVLKTHHSWWINESFADIGSELTEEEHQELRLGHKNFENNFPGLYLYLNVLFKSGRGENLIRDIAIVNRNDAPDFAGLDLWLKRRSLLYLANKYQLRFLYKYVRKITIFELSYIAMKSTIPPSCFQRIINFIPKYEKSWEEMYRLFPIYIGGRQ